ncbi:unnamed protein product [Spirodela intermedia]|uniref:Uncharacterized protein n=1 Tax=Spirodela intermedia TaxID=51605 RepID=A0A7I8KVQ9_SPIIN|nr:unnamed protein product [Spirodela intermedia]
MLPSRGRVSLCRLAIPLFHHGSQSLSCSSSPAASALTLQRLLSKHLTSFTDLGRAHSLVITSGHSSNPFLAAKLISLYADFRRADLSTGVFSAAIARQPVDTFLWNSIIKSHFSNGNFRPALHLYCQMLAQGARPNHFTIPLVASACAELLELAGGSCVHGASLKSGLLGLGSAGVGSALVYMYSKSQAIGDALRLFGEMPEKDVISWTAIIVGCAMNGDPELALVCLRDMHGGGARPNSRTLEVGLKACGSLEALLEGSCLQGLAVKSGSWCCHSVRSSMLSLYSKCGSLDDACVVFEELPTKDLISWTEILGKYARMGLVAECSRLFCAMVADGVHPDGVSVSCLLSAFATCGSIRAGGALHGFLLRKDLLSEKLVVRSLLEMYCRLRRPTGARAVFDMIEEKDEESWARMLSGLWKMESSAECLNLFRDMQFLEPGIEASADCVVPAISSCSQLQDKRSGLALHCFCVKKKLDEEISVMNSLVGMYGRGPKADYSRRIFDLMGRRRDVVTWNTLMTARARAGRSSEALELFDQMLSEDVEPSPATLVIVLSACSDAAALRWGELAHGYIREKGLECDASLSTTLIDMYAKCGRLDEARNVFDSMGERDAVAWNAMISAYGGHGRAEEALQVFEEMGRAGVSPNEVTFIAALSACSRAGMVEQGRRVFGSMGDHSVAPTSKHYACMVDLLGRSGRLEEAEAMAFTVPAAPDSGVWGALLGACRLHGNVEMGERAGKKALELEPENDGYYMVLSNLYNSVGRKADAIELREAMVSRGVRKSAGWSMAELDGVVEES